MPGTRGNHNALKHGVYSKKFVETNTLTIEQRRAIMDACIDRAFQILQVANIDKDWPPLLNALSNAMNAANNCDRTLAIVNGNYTPLEDVINALRNLDPTED